MTAAHLQHLHQVALNCSDLQLTIKFYRDVLGLSLIAEFSPPGIAFFQLGQTRLMLQQVAGATSASSVLYFAVQDVNAAQAALSERGRSLRGAASSNPPRHDGHIRSEGH